MHIKLGDAGGGSWKYGTPYVKIDNGWKQGEAYFGVNSLWSKAISGEAAVDYTLTPGHMGLSVNVQTGYDVASYGSLEPLNFEGETIRALFGDRNSSTTNLAHFMTVGSTLDGNITVTVEGSTGFDFGVSNNGIWTIYSDGEATRFINLMEDNQDVPLNVAIDYLPSSKHVLNPGSIVTTSHNERGFIASEPLGSLQPINLEGAIITELSSKKGLTENYIKLNTTGGDLSGMISIIIGSESQFDFGYGSGSWTITDISEVQRFDDALSTYQDTDVDISINYKYVEPASNFTMTVGKLSTDLGFGTIISWVANIGDMQPRTLSGYTINGFGTYGDTYILFEMNNSLSVPEGVVKVTHNGTTFTLEGGSNQGKFMSTTVIAMNTFRDLLLANVDLDLEWEIIYIPNV